MKRIKPFLLLLLLFVCFLVPIEIHTASADYVTRVEPKVYVTNYGDKYHSYNCQYLYGSKIAIGIYKAKDEGYTACSVCGGKSNGTIQEQYFSNNGSRDSTYYSPSPSTSSSKKEEKTSIWGVIGLTVLIIGGGGTVVALLSMWLNNPFKTPYFNSMDEDEQDEEDTK